MTNDHGRRLVAAAVLAFAGATAAGLGAVASGLKRGAMSHYETTHEVGVNVMYLAAGLFVLEFILPWVSAVGAWRAARRRDRPGFPQNRR